MDENMRAEARRGLQASQTKGWRFWAAEQQQEQGALESLERIDTMAKAGADNQTVDAVLATYQIFRLLSEDGLKEIDKKVRSKARMSLLTEVLNMVASDEVPPLARATHKLCIAACGEEAEGALVEAVMGTGAQVVIKVVQSRDAELATHLAACLNLGEPAMLFNRAMDDAHLKKTFAKITLRDTDGAKSVTASGKRRRLQDVERYVIDVLATAPPLLLRADDKWTVAMARLYQALVGSRLAKAGDASRRILKAVAERDFDSGGADVVAWGKDAREQLDHMERKGGSDADKWLVFLNVAEDEAKVELPTLRVLVYGACQVGTEFVEDEVKRAVDDVARLSGKPDESLIELMPIHKTLMAAAKTQLRRN